MPAGRPTARRVGSFLLALPQLGPGAAGWLLPSLGLTASSLALATGVEPLRAIGITAGAWIVAVVVTVPPPAPSRTGLWIGLGIGGDAGVIGNYMHNQAAPNLGKIGEVVRVRDGYARNYLLPRGLVLEANKKNLKTFEHHKKVVGDQKQKIMRNAQTVGDQLNAL